MISRRFLVAALGAATIAPAGAQQSSLRRIGVLVGGAEADPESQSRLAAFRSELQRLGWTEGRTAQLEYRFASGDPERARRLAAELIASSPDVILANSAFVVRTLIAQTSSIPIVFAVIIDPVGEGFVDSLAQPGRNVTGFTSFEYATSGKWLELLTELAPGMRRAVVVNHRGNTTGDGYLRALEEAAPRVGVSLAAAHVDEAADLERAIAAAGQLADAGLVVLPSPFTQVNRALIVAAAARHRLPAAYPFRYFVESGGLMYYGPDATDVFRRSTAYVDRILKGEKPASLPVQHPTRYLLSINLKTAKMLGLDVSSSLLARADEVIE